MKWLTPFFVLQVLLASSQTFIAETSLPKVEADGFYRVLLDPNLLVYTSGNFANLRILDNRNQEVPYIITEESPEFLTATFKDYIIQSKRLETNCCTQLILKNPDRKPINNISLIIKNAETHKSATLLGSDDQGTWYALKEQFYLNPVNSESQTYEARILNFPLSNYAFLQINIDDSTSAPLNILRAGYYETQTQIGTYTNVPSFSLTVSDSLKQKQTVVSVRFDTTRLVDKLEFTISGQSFYHRQATLYSQELRKNKKGKIESYDRYLRQVELTSTHVATILLDGEKVQHLILMVENNDNPSLQFPVFQAWQLNRYLTAHLKKDVEYWLKTGDEKLEQPEYDLAFFKDTIPNQPAVIKTGKIRLIKKEIGNPGSPSFFTSKIFIWSAIIGVAVILAFMTFKMVQEKSTDPRNKRF